MTDKPDLDELARLLETATPGEWIAQSTDTEGPDYGVCIVAENLGGLVEAAFMARDRLIKEGFLPVDPTVRALNTALAKARGGRGGDGPFN